MIYKGENTNIASNERNISNTLLNGRYILCFNDKNSFLLIYFTSTLYVLISDAISCLTSLVSSISKALDDSFTSASRF